MLTKLLEKLNNLSDFVPKSYICYKEGYNSSIIRSDLIAGITVGIISLPLVMAFAIGAGVNPDRGLFTAIVGGFLISLLGGSRVQIGGPTGAFIPILYMTVQRHGYDGLVVAAILAGIMMMIFGFARAGVLLKFIPYPVTTGFTSGIAVAIFSSQIKDFFGLQMKGVPPHFVDKVEQYYIHAATWNPWAIGIGILCLGIMIIIRKLYPKIPGAIIAVVISTYVVWFFNIPIETVAKKFGTIPNMLPEPSLPAFDWDQIVAVFPDAITIAMLSSIEALLSAVVADGMSGNKHRSNMELVAQGFANIGSVIFGGIPATGAVARTAANVKLGAKTPLAGMVHALTVFALMFVFAPLAAEIPLACLAALLIFVAYNMSEKEHFIDILKGPRSDALILLITFGLTVLIDITVAVQIGVVMAAISFLKKMTESSRVEVCKMLVEENGREFPQESDLIFRKDVPENTQIFEINGPFFFGISEALNDQLRFIHPEPKYFILRVSRMSMIDATGIHALKQFAAKCKQKGIVFMIAGARDPKIVSILRKNGIYKTLGEGNVFTHLDLALAHVKSNAIQLTTIAAPGIC